MRGIINYKLDRW